MENWNRNVFQSSLYTQWLASSGARQRRNKLENVSHIKKHVCKLHPWLFEWEMSSSSFWKRNSPSTGICLGISLSFIAVMYQTFWFTIYKWLWCRIWEFMTKEVESHKSDKTYFLNIKIVHGNQMLAISYSLNDIKGRGEPNIFIRFMI